MTDLEQIRDDILQEMYEAAEPGLDWSDVLENPDDYGDEWYSQHYLPKEESQEILHKHLDKHPLTEDERSALTWTCILDLGPSNVHPDEQRD